MGPGILLASKRDAKGYGRTDREARDSHVNWTRRLSSRARGPRWYDVGATWIAFPMMARAIGSVARAFISSFYSFIPWVRTCVFFSN